MRALLAFVRLGRPLFLGGGIVGFALGAAAARFEGRALALVPYLWGQGLVTAFHLMVHYANEYYDRDGDALAVRTPFSGGSGVLVAGDLPPGVALRAALACGALGTIAIAHAALGGAWALALIGVGIGLLSWAYSAPPLRLLARGLGELDTGVVVGVLVPLAGFTCFAGAVDRFALAATVPGLCAIFAMMLCVELPDRRADAASGKRTLVVRWGGGRAVAVAAAAGVAAVAALILVGLIAFGAAGARVAAAALVPAALALGLAACARRALPPVVPPLLGTALYATTTLAGLALVTSP